MTTRVIVIIRDGVVNGVCSDDPTLDVAVLDYDMDEANQQALSDEADQLTAVY